MKALWQAVLWEKKWKAGLACACRRLKQSLTSLAVSVCWRVWFWDNNRRLVCGLYTAEDNDSWQVCLDQTLHRQPPSLPSFCLPALPVHRSVPTTPHSLLPQGGDHGHHHSEHCLVVLLWGQDGTLRFMSLSTHTVLCYLQIGFAGARGEQRQRFGGWRRVGTGGQWINHESLVHTKKTKM